MNETFPVDRPVACSHHTAVELVKFYAIIGYAKRFLFRKDELLFVCLTMESL